MEKMRSLPLCALACALLLPVFSSAQQAAPTIRIAGPIDEGQLVTLKGNTVPAANAQNDRGPVSASLPMSDLVLVLSRSPEQQAAFDAYVQSEYDSGSPNYHQWLTPDQIGQRFGPAQADISTIASWLTSHGFAVTRLAKDRMSISFSGTAGQVETAFHTVIHNLEVHGAPHIANMTDPQIPAALSSVVIGVKGLHNFLPHPLHRVGSKVQFNADAHGWVKQQNSLAASLGVGALSAQASIASVEAGSWAKPNFYLSSGYLGVEEDVSPNDFATIYNLTPVWNNSITGSGQTIAVVGTSDINLTDVSSFKSAFGLPAGKTPVIAHGPDGDPGICSGSTNTCNAGDLDENSLDVEWSGAVAPGAQIVLVTDAYNNNNPQLATNDPIFDGAQWIVDNAAVSGSAVYGANIISVSYGQCELFNGTSGNVAYNNLWQTAAGAGIAVFVATGDSGSPSCDQGGDSIGNPYEAQYGLTVSGLASTPYNTAVGGTDFSWCKPSLITSGSSAGNVQGCASSNASTYWNTSNGTTQASAKGYVPETPWNDSCENPINAAFLESIASYVGAGTYTTPEESCNFVYEDSLSLYFNYGDPPLMSYVDTAGGSGGASGCVVSSGASSTSPGTCTGGATSTGSSYGNLTLVNNGWPKPSWQTGVTGIPNDGVRDLPDVSFFAGDGSLDSATLICVTNDGASCTSISQTGTSNTGGAEEVGGTSVATPEMAGVMALINQKAGAAQGNPNAELYTLATKQTYSGCSAESGSTSSNCNFNDIDQGTNSMPCVAQSGTLEGGATYAGSGNWASTTAAAGTVSPNCSVVNSGDTIGALSGYGAVTGYDQATGLGSLNIANVVNNWTAAVAGTKTATVSVTPGPASISMSQSLNVTVTVTGASGTPTGTVTLSASANSYSSAQTLSGGTVTFTIPADTFTAAGTVTLTAYYSGDATYATSSGTAAVTITGSTGPSATFALGSIASPAAIAPGASASATATVSSSSGYVGTVALSCSLTGSPTGASNLPTCSSSGTIALSATATSGTATLSVTTTPTTTTELRMPANGKGLLGAGAGAVLAMLFFFGIPARRRSWRAMLGMLLLITALGSLAACGGGGSSGGGTTTIPGTTAGTYTFTVTATGAPSISTTQSQTFTVTVN